MMLLVLLLMAAQTAWAQDPSLESLEKESDNVYLIKSADDLNTLSDYVNANHTCEGLTFKVTANITFSAPANESESNFTAIGTRNSKFRGTFDGGNNLGYTIRGIRINGSTYGQGLFGNIYGARIQNVTIEDAVIKSTANCVGGIVGSSENSTIANCTSSATVTGDGTFMCGGIAGSNSGSNSGTITNCTSRATVSANSSCGGIAGSNSGTITNCTTSNATVSASLHCGGIAGYNYVAITNCTTSSATVSARSNCGGIAGSNYGAITNCTTSSATVSVTQSESGAIAGYDNKGTYSNNYYYDCTVNNKPNATDVGINGADIQDGAVSTTKNFVKIILPECFEITGGVIYGDNYVEKDAEIQFSLKTDYKLKSDVTKDGGTKISADDDGIYTVKISGQTTITAEFESRWNIYTAEDLKSFSEMVNSGQSFEGKTVKLMNSINLSNVTDFTPIGTEYNRFKGTFDGGGNTLTLALKGGNNEKYLAPFRYVEGATFKKLIVAGTIESKFNSSGDGTHGGFVGLCYYGATFEDCAFVGSLLGPKAHSCGGFVGAAMNFATISYKNCLFAPEKITMSAEGSATFNRYDTPSDYSTCYYTQSFGEVQGIKVVKKQKDSPLNAIYTGSILKLADGNEYYEPVVVEGLSKGYWSIDATIFTSVKYNGVALEEGKDYSVVGYKNEKGEVISSIAAPGKYTLTITGNGDYAGTLTHSFDIISGTGEENDPYIIKTPAQLDALSALVNGGNDCKDKHFRLGNSIEYDGKTENNFTAIGTYDHPFNGTFDGGNNLGYTISGIRINASTDYQGLFGYADENATIRNVTIEDSEIKSSENYVGGIVGYNDGGTIENCTSRAEFTATESDCWVYGGIVGCNNGGTLIGNLAIDAEIPSIRYTGAIAGAGNGTLSYNYYYNCNVNGTPNATGVGCNGADKDGALPAHKLTLPDDITIKDSDNPLVIHYKTNYYCKAGIDVKLSCVIQEGEVALANNTVIRDNAFTMPDEDVEVTVVDKPDGYAFVLPECFEITNGVELIYGEYVKTIPTIVQFAPKFGYKVLSDVTCNDVKITPTDGIYTVTVAENENNNNNTTTIAATSEKAWAIYTVRDLKKFSEMVSGGKSFAGETVTLMNTIDFKPSTDETNNFTPIGTEKNPFKGTFDGGGHTLTFHLRYGDQQKFCAPFSFVDGATFRDLIVDGTIESEFSTPGDGTHGGFVGVSNGNTSFENCAFVGSLLGVNANSNGGFVGWANKKITYTNCLFAPTKITMSTEGSATFNRNANKEDFSTCYYTQPFGTEQGVKVYKLTLLDGITTTTKALFEYKGVSYYVSGSVIELSVDNYYVNGESASCKLKIDGDYIVSKTEVPEIKINGDGDATVSVPELAAANVTYTRTFSAGIYTTIMLPFDFKASYFDGETFYTFAGVNTQEWTATMTNVEADDNGVVILKANTPYIFQPSEATAKESTFTFNGVKVTAEGNKATSDDKGWTFQGTYEKIVWNEDKNKPKTTTNVYGFAATAKDNVDGEQIIAAGEFVRAGYNVSIRPTRAYLEYNGEDNSLRKSALALPERIKVVFIDKETATVIDDPNITDDPNGDISTPTSEIQPALESVKVWSYDKTIFISARPGTDYRIIDANGRLLRTSTTQSDRDEIRLGRASGIVIVIIGNKAYKLNY